MKMAPFWLLELNALLKSSTSKYWEEFSKSDSLTASLSLSVMTFSMELLFLVKALNLIVLPWIVEWKSLSFSAEKGYNFFEQVKQHHTVLSLINKLYVRMLILLHLMWFHRSQLSYFTALWFLATGFRQIWKILSGTYSTFQKLFGFLLLCIQKDKYKEICIIKERLK